MTAPFLVSSAGRYVWSDRPFVYAFTNGVLTVSSELLFSRPQWNNWIEIAIQGMNQACVDAYTEALARNGFPCGVYIMDGGWLSCQGSYRFHAPDFPDPKGMFRRIREKGWKSMVWTAAFVSPDSREYKLLRYGRGCRVTGRDVLAYDKARAGRHAGVVWWWSGISCVWGPHLRARLGGLRADARALRVGVADMVGGGEATTYRPGSFFSERLFVRSCALHPMMQFSAAPWRYLSPANVEACRAFAELHVAFAPYILDLARHAARTGEPIVRAMEYEFPHAGLALRDVPLARLPRFERLASGGTE